MGESIKPHNKGLALVFMNKILKKDLMVFGQKMVEFSLFASVNMFSKKAHPVSEII